MEREIQFYKTADGFEPFRYWLESQMDDDLVKRVLIRLERIEFGNLGDYKSLGSGLYELRLFYGGGVRIYFGMFSRGRIVLILCGGIKNTQTKDIKKAKAYLVDFKKVNL